MENSKEGDELKAAMVKLMTKKTMDALIEEFTRERINSMDNCELLEKVVQIIGASFLVLKGGDQWQASTK